MKSVNAINPDNITRIKIMDSKPSDKFMVQQYNNRTSWFGLRKKLKTPKLGVRCVDYAVQAYESIDSFFERPMVKESFFKPKITSIPPGEIVWLMFKPAVYIELCSGEHHTKYFNSIEERDEYVLSNGLDKIIEKFIKL